MKFNKIIFVLILVIGIANILMTQSVKDDLKVLEKLNNKESSGNRYDGMSHYLKMDMKGFIVYVNKSVPDDDKELINQKLEECIERIVGSLNSEMLKTLRKVSVWVEKPNAIGGISAVHFSHRWLTENNVHPDKLGNIEIVNVNEFVKALNNGEPNQLLHEFAHALQFSKKFPSRDFDNEIRRHYENAIEQGLYSSVASIYNENLVDAYATHNMKEYFAELTESYFGANDYFPFNRNELKQYDPLGYQFAKKVWGGS